MTDEYYDIDFQQKHPTVKGYWVQADKFTEMYRKATALDKIRDEIEREADYQDAYVNADVAKGLYMALDIIDKYTSEMESKGE